MRGSSKRCHAFGTAADDKVWAGADRSDPYIDAESDMPTAWPIRAIVVVYAAIVCLAVILAF